MGDNLVDNMAGLDVSDQLSHCSYLNIRGAFCGVFSCKCDSNGIEVDTLIASVSRALIFSPALEYRSVFFN